MGESAVSRIVDIAVGASSTGSREGVPPYDTRVFVPAHPRYPQGAEPRVEFELLAHPSGPPVPVAFTSLDNLVAALGDAQPWIALALGAFAETMRRAKLPSVRLDPTVDPGAHTWRIEDLNEAYGQWAQGEAE